MIITSGRRDMRSAGKMLLNLMLETTKKTKNVKTKQDKRYPNERTLLRLGDLFANVKHKFDRNLHSPSMRGPTNQGAEQSCKQRQTKNRTLNRTTFLSACLNQIFVIRPVNNRTANDRCGKFISLLSSCFLKVFFSFHCHNTGPAQNWQAFIRATGMIRSRSQIDIKWFEWRMSR